MAYGLMSGPLTRSAVYTHIPRLTPSTPPNLFRGKAEPERARFGNSTIED